MTGGVRGPGPTLRVGVAVPAAGHGRRMGGARKPYLVLAGEPILVHALRPFLARADVVAVAVALAPDEAKGPSPWPEGLDPRIVCVAGGETRTASVRAALGALPDALDVIVIHDAARPLLDADVLDRCIAAAAGGEGAVAGVPAVDTLKEVGPDRRVVRTPDRARFWQAQTPQAFPAALIRAAYAGVDREEGATDDASLVERIGGTVVMVESSPRNLKVTHREDVAFAEALLGAAGDAPAGLASAEHAGNAGRLP